MDEVTKLFVHAIPVACIAWTVTKEELFRELQDLCKKCIKSNNFCLRKFFFGLHCEYCFAHWVTLVMLYFTGFKMQYEGFLGSVFAFFSVAAIANVYMAIYLRLRIDIRAERAEADILENKKEAQAERNGQTAK